MSRSRLLLIALLMLVPLAACGEKEEPEATGQEPAATQAADACAKDQLELEEAGKLTVATDNGLARAAELLDMTVPEVMNRATIAGAIEIGRHPGVVQVTFRAPADRLEARGLLGYAEEQYG